MMQTTAGALAGLPIWVLNLKRSPERRRFMAQQLDALGIGYQFIEAVDGRLLTTAQLARYSRKKALRLKGRELIPGEIATAVSHGMLWQRIVDELIPEVLIFEDDTVIDPRLPAVLEQRDRFPADWELINLYTDPNRRRFPFGKPLAGFCRPCRFYDCTNRLNGYLLRQEGARKLLARLEPIRMPIDDLTGYPFLTGIVSYGVDPQLVSVGDFPSDIWDGRTGQRKVFLWRAREWWSLLCRQIPVLPNVPGALPPPRIRWRPRL